MARPPRSTSIQELPPTAPLCRPGIPRPAAPVCQLPQTTALRVTAFTANLPACPRGPALSCLPPPRPEATSAPPIGHLTPSPSQPQALRASSSRRRGSFPRHCRVTMIHIKSSPRLRAVTVGLGPAVSAAVFLNRRCAGSSSASVDPAPSGLPPSLTRGCRRCQRRRAELGFRPGLSPSNPISTRSGPEDARVNMPVDRYLRRRVGLHLPPTKIQALEPP